MSAPWPDAVRVVDSHTEGEPTRVVVEGWPLPPGDDLAARRAALDRDQGALRRGVVAEPRGHEAVVGALLLPPTRPDCAAGVIFFNNVGTLGMCGHGTMGVVRTLAHLGRLSAGEVKLETPVGVVAARLEEGGAITVTNVPCRVHALDVEVAVPGLGTIRGDLAWGGNWFFLVAEEGPLELARRDQLLARTRAVLAALAAAPPLPPELGRVDHVELVGPGSAGGDARNFVLCPGGEYDRSPCGTGTSAKLAALHARGRLRPGQVWRQEGIAGGSFDAWLTEEGGELVPHLRGRAWVTAESVLRFAPDDPFRAGIG